MKKALKRIKILSIIFALFAQISSCYGMKERLSNLTRRFVNSFNRLPVAPTAPQAPVTPPAEAATARPVETPASPEPTSTTAPAPAARKKGWGEKLSLSHQIRTGVTEAGDELLPKIKQVGDDLVLDLEKKAEELRKKAAKDADKLLKDATKEANQTFKKTGNDLLADAEKRGKALLHDAEKKAQALITSAEKTAKKLLDDAEKRSDNVIQMATDNALKKLENKINDETFQKSLSTSAQKVIDNIKNSATGSESLLDRYFNTMIYTLCGIGGASVSIIAQVLEDKKTSPITEINPSKKSYVTKLLRSGFAGLAMTSVAYTYLKRKNLSFWGITGLFAMLNCLKCSELLFKHEAVKENTIKVLKAWPTIQKRLFPKKPNKTLDDLHERIVAKERITNLELTQATKLLKEMGFNNDINGVLTNRS